MDLFGSDLTVFNAFFGAIRNRLSCEYQNTEYHGPFQDFCDSRMPEIMDTLIPPWPANLNSSLNRDNEVKEAFDDWFHNRFKFEQSNNEKANMLKAWKGAEEVYNL